MNKIREANPKGFFIKILLWCLAVTLCPVEIRAEDGQDVTIKDRYGFAATLGKSYDPFSDINFFMLTGVAIYDYDRIWPHKAPDPLRFKVELSAGCEKARSEEYLMASFGILALYFLDDFSNLRFRPYIEAGIGAIYTGFKVEGQGLSLNFNPQMGLGTEVNTKSGVSYFLNIRLHHLSNAGIDQDNRGVNSVVIMIGRLF